MAIQIKTTSVNSIFSKSICLVSLKRRFYHFLPSSTTRGQTTTQSHTQNTTSNRQKGIYRKGEIVTTSQQQQILIREGGESGKPATKTRSKHQSNLLRQREPIRQGIKRTYHNTT